MSIQLLPPDVVAQIKSSVTITTLNGVVCELVKNSLDADAAKVDISVDYSKGSCSVEDDGFGILPSEFQTNGHLGKLYHTSKLNSHTQVHGGRGTFLASLSALALVSMTSHHHLHRSHNSLTLHKSAVVSRQVPAPEQQHLTSSQGTRVTVRDLFGNMPVRVKQRALAAEKERGHFKDWEMLRRDIIGLLLPWPRDVVVSIRDSQTNHKMTVRPSSMPFQYGRMSRTSVCNILAQASFISHNQKTSWISVHASTPELEISGAISMEPIANKHVQFLSFGIHPILASDGQSIFHDEINRLFSNSAFGVEENVEEIDGAEQDRRAKDGRFRGDGYTNKELKGVKKGVDRWPMFFINIQISGQGRSICGVEDVLKEKKNAITSILELLRVLVLEFLTKNHFRPRSSRVHQSSKTSQAAIPVQTAKAFASSAPGKHGEKTPKRSSVGMKDGSDTFGANVRLPSFRQGVPLPNSPFDAWSRVKKGAVSRPTTPKIFKDLGGSATSRPATAPPLLFDASTASKTSTPYRLKTKPLLSKDGKLLRAPFDDVILKPDSQPCPTSSAPNTSLRSDHTSDHVDDEVIPWINPMTKVQTLVNKRTGLTMKSTGYLSFSSQTLRLTTSVPSQRHSQVPPSPWISDLLRTWENPVFAPAEASVPQISFDVGDSTAQSILHGHQHHCSHVDIDRVFRDISSGINGRISKDSLKHADIISQVDQKFVLVKLESTRSKTSDVDNASMLVLIDQHAADERIRVEALMEELCTPSASDSTESCRARILTAPLLKSLHFDLSKRETELLQTFRRHFSEWGILYTISSSTTTSTVSRLTVTSLPAPILERCQSAPGLLIDLIRTELWKVHENHTSPTQPLPQGDWLQRIHSCPQGILDMINSRACRSAIMFNDVLSTEQCETLVRKLAECKFPFQCAHGRPSLVPLVDLAAFNVGAGMKLQEEEGSFGKEFRKWKGNLEGN
ncbi:DNA mismatch repair protein [Cadophora gregata]|uniref:DNA mismatch repair protein n=1 Tax=Cadophora gregata TaxID=51156 RepID=UPI0026DD23D2|nr:DNA mismatch repair protein [Cadophora gregata]KAK0106812.1 DNA mismatch repair protein [Cadophora gregata]